MSEAMQSDVCRHGMKWSFIFSLCYGVGGIAFNMSIRYIGFALTYAIAVGLSAVLGTVIPVLTEEGKLNEVLQQEGLFWVIAGLVIGILGIAACGLAGRFKEQDLASQDSSSEFNMKKGLFVGHFGRCTFCDVWVCN